MDYWGAPTQLLGEELLDHHQVAWWRYLCGWLPASGNKLLEYFVKTSSLQVGKSFTWHLAKRATSFPYLAVVVQNSCVEPNDGVLD
jgi:hypothetical protein